MILPETGWGSLAQNEVSFWSKKFSNLRGCSNCSIWSHFLPQFHEEAAPILWQDRRTLPVSESKNPSLCILSSRWTKQNRLILFRKNCNPLFLPGQNLNDFFSTVCFIVFSLVHFLPTSCFHLIFFLPCGQSVFAAFYRSRMWWWSGRGEGSGWSSRSQKVCFFLPRANVFGVSTRVLVQSTPQCPAIHKARWYLGMFNHKIAGITQDFPKENFQDNSLESLWSSITFTLVNPRK